MLGQMVELGYFWAINRSYDVTYRFQDFTTRGFGHHVDFRGKPTARADFDAILFGVQDRGLKQARYRRHESQRVQPQRDGQSGPGGRISGPRVRSII